MKKATGYSLVLVTAPELKTARRLAQAALKRRLVACANIVPALESHYWWQGKIERSPEVLLLLKSKTSRLRALEKLVLEQHPYDTPEFVVLNVQAATERYLNWWNRCVAAEL